MDRWSHYCQYFGGRQVQLLTGERCVCELISQGETDRLHSLMTNDQVIELETKMWGNYWCDKCGEPMHDCKKFGCEMD